MTPGAVVEMTPATRTPTQRLRHVRSTVAALPALGLEIQALPDGRQAVVLPAGLVDFFVEDLAHRAAEWKEQARKARVVEMERDAELKAATGEARREWEATADAWTAEYLRLREAGKGHREAIRSVRGPKTDRRAHPQLGTVTLGVTEGLARRRAAERAQRDTRVCDLARAGMPCQAIADRLRLSYPTIYRILRHAGVPTVAGDRTAGLRTAPARRDQP